MKFKTENHKKLYYIKTTQFQHGFLF